MKSVRTFAFETAFCVYTDAILANAVSAFVKICKTYSINVYKTDNFYTRTFRDASGTSTTGGENSYLCTFLNRLKDEIQNYKRI